MNPLNLMVQVLDKFELLVSDLVLLLQLIILVLESANGDLQQLVLSFALHRTVLVELVL